MTSATRHRRRRRLTIRHILGGWAILVALFLLWETFTYSGLMALAAEWQFNAFGRYYPTLTYVLLLLLIASPVLWLVRPRRPVPDSVARRRVVQLPGRSFIRVVLGVAIGCAVAAIGVLFYTTFLPDDKGIHARIVVGGPSSAQPALGPTQLVGDVIANRLAGFSEELIVTRRSIRFAPLLSPGGRDEALRFFVEVPATDTLVRAQRAGAFEGVLRRGGLPGEIERLYRYVGFEVAEPYYVLYASSASLRWTYWVAASELAVAALIAALTTLGLHLRRERQRRRLADEDGQPAV